MLRLAASATGGARLRTPCPLPRIGEGGLYPQSLHKNAPAAPYKRRLIPLRECAAFPGGANGAPQGRKTVWGEEDAPQRGGLPKVKHRVSPTQAEVASDERTGF